MNGKRWFPYVLLALGIVLALAVGAAAAQHDDEQPFLGFGFEAGNEGVVVTRLLPGGPADTAGLEEGDVITAVDGETVTADTIADLIGTLSVGDEVALSVTRGDETLDLTATLGSRDELMPAQPDRPNVPNMPDIQIPDVRGMMQQRVFLGVSLEDTDDGVIVREVVPGSPAATAGIEADDVITAVNGETVSEARQVVELIAGLEAGDPITLDITRDGEAQTIEATLAEGGAFPAVPMGRFSQDVVIYDASQNVWQIVNLSEDSPLYAAGLRAGDQITGVNGEAVAPDALMELLNELEADATATLTVQRDGEELTFDVPAEALQTFTQLPILRGDFGTNFGDDFGGMMPFGFGGQNRAQLGVGIVDLTAETAAEEGVEVTQGALVREVAPESPAEEAGVQVDDIITAVDGDVVDEERTLRDRLFAYEPGDTVTLSVTRGDETLDIDVTLAEADMPMFEGFSPEGVPFRFNIPVVPGQPEGMPEQTGPMA